MDIIQLLTSTFMKKIFHSLTKCSVKKVIKSMTNFNPRMNEYTELQYDEIKCKQNFICLKTTKF